MSILPCNVLLTSTALATVTLATGAGTHDLTRSYRYTVY